MLSDLRSSSTTVPKEVAPDGFSPVRGGFTLVELLVVIVVIGILLAITVPVTQSALESSRKVQCTANIRQLVGAIRLSAADHYDRLPNEATWSATVAPYVGLNASDPNLLATGVFRCPSGWLAGASTAANPATYNYNYHSGPFTANGATSTEQWNNSPSLTAFIHPQQTLLVTCWWMFRWSGWSGNVSTPPSTTHPYGRPTGYLDGHVVVETAPGYYQNGSLPAAALENF